MSEQEREVLKRALDYYDRHNQVLKTIEELSELQIELVHTSRFDERASWKNIAEEIADVEIMLEQLKMVMPDNDIEKIKSKKIRRLERRLTEDQNNSERFGSFRP